jgi:hypothetical protein
MKQNAQNILPKNAALLKRFEKLNPQTLLKKTVVSKKPQPPKKHTFTCGSLLISSQI